MNTPAKGLIASLIAISSFCGVGAFADAPDVEMKLSATTLYANQELIVTISSKVYCDIQVAALGLDGQQFQEYKDSDHEVFSPPKQYKFKFAKAGKYRVSAGHGDMYCGNMKHMAMMTDIVVKPVVLLPPIAQAGTPPVATPKPATPAKPMAKPCAKKLGQQVDPNCVAD